MNEPAMTRREQLAFCVFATWSVVGLFLDGWSHRRSKPESFFSVYHAVLYSGVAAGALFAAFESGRQRRAGEKPTLPAGSRLTALGLGVFALGGVGDGVWHQVFGIEADTEALLSPTHLLLFVGGMLLSTAPFRAAWATDTDDAPTLTAFLPRLLGLSLATGIVSFFTMFLHPFLADDLGQGEEAAEFWIAGLLVTTVVLVVPLLLASRRWRLPQGSCTVHLVVVTALVLGLEGFQRPGILLAAAVAGVAGDLALAAKPWLAAAVVPAVLWPGYFAVFKVTDGLDWTVELWGGATFVAALGGLGLGLLAAPMPGREERALEGARPDHAVAVGDAPLSRPR
jgi:hypothetical protein